MIPANQSEEAHRSFESCFSEATQYSSDKCSTVQLSVLCRPLILLKYAEGCSFFDELYQAEINTRDWTECPGSREKLNPCDTALKARFSMCSGFSVLSSTHLLVLTAFIFSYRFH